MDFKSLKESLVHVFQEIIETPPQEEKDVTSENRQKKNQQSLPERREPSWRERENAKYYRKQCWRYGPAVFRSQLSLSNCFGNALREVFKNVSGFKFRKYYDETDICFITVNVYGLRPEFDKRGINLKELILDSLKEALVRYASPQIDLSPWLEYVVTNVWLQKNLLVIEIPWSGFYYQYFSCATTLMSDKYKELIHLLDKVDEL